MDVYELSVTVEHLARFRDLCDIWHSETPKQHEKKNDIFGECIANMCLIGCRHRKSQNTFLVILSTMSTTWHTNKNLKTGGGIDYVKNLNI